MSPAATSRDEALGGLTDSPWFWSALFSVMAIIALFAIGPKFGLRQGRLDDKFGNRVQAQRYRQEYAAEHDPAARERGGESEVDRADEIPDESTTQLRGFRQLLPLSVVLSSVFLFSLYRLLQRTKGAS